MLRVSGFLLAGICISDMSDTPKPKRQQRAKDDFGSKTKQKGSPVVGKQASTLFGQPNAPKPGVTSAQRILAIRAAELAAKLQVDFLEEIDKHVTALRKKGATAEVIAVATANVRGIMTDAMDREFGKAGSSIDITSSDGSAKLPNVIKLVGPDENIDE